MNKYLLACCLLVTCFVKVPAQSENETIDMNYLEDQIYWSLTYGILNNKPAGVEQNGFSGGFTTGFIKDIPLNKERNVGFGVGLGYAYTIYIQNLKISGPDKNTLFEIAQDYNSNKLKLHALECPIEFRWRKSTAEKYKFWRIYGGLKVSYLFSASTTYKDQSETVKTKNIPELNKFQYGVMISAGYSTWNFYVYYGLNPIFKDADFNGEKLNLKDINIGLKFYIM